MNVEAIYWENTLICKLKHSNICYNNGYLVTFIINLLYYWLYQ